MSVCSEKPSSARIPEQIGHVLSTSYATNYLEEVLKTGALHIQQQSLCSVFGHTIWTNAGQADGVLDNACSLSAIPIACKPAERRQHYWLKPSWDAPWNVTPPKPLPPKFNPVRMVPLGLLQLPLAEWWMASAQVPCGSVWPPGSRRCIGYALHIAKCLVHKTASIVSTLSFSKTYLEIS